VLHRKVVALHQIEIKQKYPQEGWVEQDPKEILQAVIACIEETVKKMKNLDLSVSDIKAIGITNQRETTLLWYKRNIYRISCFSNFNDRFFVKSMCYI